MTRKTNKITMTNSVNVLLAMTKTMTKTKIGDNYNDMAFDNNKD